jgi:pimeloyl-ACP methyl ester carboxylesterase
MQPFHFGPDRRLFGIYQPPQGAAKSAGVVLCQPLGHEYVRTHRAFRNLAQQLARAGFPVVRFDYFGSGDSAGDGADVRLQDCTADLAAAIDELKRRARVGQVTLVGLRLGAAIGALTAAARRDVRAIVLWDPVVSGAAYMQQLVQLNEAWLAGRGNGPEVADERRRSWLVGCPMSDAMRGDIERVNLAALDARNFPRVVVITSDQRFIDVGWAQGVRQLYGPGSVAVVPPGGEWDNPETVHTALLPQQVLQAIAAAVAA